MSESEDGEIRQVAINSAPVNADEARYDVVIETGPALPEPMPEPETIIDARALIATLTRLVEAGEVDAISCYVEHRDGTYRCLQSGGESRHEDAGRILELALLRLGFVQRTAVEAMLDKL